MTGKQPRWQKHLRKRPSLLSAEEKEVSPAKIDNDSTPVELPHITEDLWSLVSPSIAREYEIIPVAWEGTTVVLVTKAPLHTQEVESLQFSCPDLDFRVATPIEYTEFRDNLNRLLNTYYPPPPSRISGPCCDVEPAPQKRR